MYYSPTLRKIKFLLCTLLLLVVADGIISQFLIKQGYAVEASPFLRTLVTGSDFLIIKMCGAIICILTLWNVIKRLPKLTLVFSSCVRLSIL